MSFARHNQVHTGGLYVKSDHVYTVDSLVATKRCLVIVWATSSSHSDRQEQQTP